MKITRFLPFIILMGSLTGYGMESQSLNEFELQTLFDESDNKPEDKENKENKCISKKMKKNLITVGTAGTSATLAIVLNQLLPGSAATVFTYGTFGTSLKAITRNMSPQQKLILGIMACGLCTAADYWLLPELGINNAGLFPLGFISLIVAAKRTIKELSKDKKEKIDEDDEDEVEQKKPKKNKVQEV